MTLVLSELNFRDVGGLPAHEGKRVREGVLFRSEGPAAMLPQHLDAMRSIGFGLVCDLRSSNERTAAPNSWCDERTRLLDVEITADLRADGNSAWDVLRANPTVEGALEAMRINYAAMPEPFAPYIRPLFEAVADGQLPLLVHCTAGKDRTGLVVAVLLLALGVSREDVLADYGRSGSYQGYKRLGRSMEEMFAEQFGFSAPREAIDTLSGVNPVFLQASFDEIDRIGGSFEGYLRDLGGVSPDLLNALRDVMLAPATIKVE